MRNRVLYQTGFNNHFASEAIVNTLPQGQNAPQHVAHGLYAEQLSGTAFTCPRHENQRSWLYRIRPSVCHGSFSTYKHPLAQKMFSPATNIPPDAMRWDPLPFPTKKTDFIDGLHGFAIGDHFHNTHAAAIYHYVCNESMLNRYFYNADGEWLIVPQLGALIFHTELGQLDCKPGEIIVIPRVV
jgi:homogentisate 1,2-dioxygenase